MPYAADPLGFHVHPHSRPPPPGHPGHLHPHPHPRPGAHPHHRLPPGHRPPPPPTPPPPPLVARAHLRQHPHPPPPHHHPHHHQPPPPGSPPRPGHYRMMPNMDPGSTVTSMARGSGGCSPIPPSPSKQPHLMLHGTPAPMPPGGPPCDLNRVFKTIWIGGYKALRSATLTGLGIAHVLNTSAELLMPGTPVDWADLQLNGFTIQHIKLSDDLIQRIFPFSDEIRDGLRFIHQRVSQNENILVNCSMGISRSCSMVISYLVLYQQFAVRSALPTIRTGRPWCSPNPSFIEQLLLLESTVAAAVAGVPGPLGVMMPTTPVFARSATPASHAHQTPNTTTTSAKVITGPESTATQGETVTATENGGRQPPPPTVYQTHVQTAAHPVADLLVPATATSTPAGVPVESNGLQSPDHGGPVAPAPAKIVMKTLSQQRETTLVASSDAHTLPSEILSPRKEPPMTTVTVPGVLFSPNHGEAKKPSSATLPKTVDEFCDFSKEVPQMTSSPLQVDEPQPPQEDVVNKSVEAPPVAFIPITEHHVHHPSRSLSPLVTTTSEIVLQPPQQVMAENVAPQKPHSPPPTQHQEESKGTAEYLRYRQPVVTVPFPMNGSRVVQSNPTPAPPTHQLPSEVEKKMPFPPPPHPTQAVAYPTEALARAAAGYMGGRAPTVTAASLASQQNMSNQPPPPLADSVLSFLTEDQQQQHQQRQQPQAPTKDTPVAGTPVLHPPEVISVRYAMAPSPYMDDRSASATAPPRQPLRQLFETAQPMPEEYRQQSQPLQYVTAPDGSTLIRHQSSGLTGLASPTQVHKTRSPSLRRDVSHHHHHHYQAQQNFSDAMAAAQAQAQEDVARAQAQAQAQVQAAIQQQQRQVMSGGGGSDKSGRQTPHMMQYGATTFTLNQQSQQQPRPLQPIQQQQVVARQLYSPTPMNNPPYGVPTTFPTKTAAPTPSAFPQQQQPVFSQNLFVAEYPFKVVDPPAPTTAATESLRSPSPKSNAQKSLAKVKALIDRITTKGKGE